MTEEEEAMFLANLHLVDSEIGRLASRLRIEMRGGALGVDDLLNVGRLGLVEAVKRWRPDGGSSFRSYANLKIRGAALDEVRRLDFVSRSARDRVDAALARGEEVEGFGLVSIERSGDEEGGGLAEVLPCGGRDAAAEMEVSELGRLAFEWIEEFPADYQAVIRGLYVEGKPMREVGEDLGVTESRVCQMHAAAMEWYRARLRWLGVEVGA